MHAVAIFFLVVAAIVVAGLAGLVIFNAFLAWRAQALVPPVGKFITVDGTRLHYLDRGSGPAVVMLHGLASQLQTFTYAMQARLPGYRLIMVDRPGSGYSKPAASAALSAQAQVLSDFLRALGVDRALLVGHSLGGALSLAFAIDHPEQTAGLALIAPATQAQDEPPEALKGLFIQSDVMRWLIGWTIAAPIGILNRDRILPALFSPDPVPDDFATRGGSVLGMRPWTYRNAARDLAEAGGEFAYYAARQNRISMPIGVIYGTGDQILDHVVHGVGLQKQIPDLDLQLMHGGHMLPFSAPERCAAFVEQMAARAGLVPHQPIVTSTTHSAAATQQ